MKLTCSEMFTRQWMDRFTPGDLGMATVEDTPDGRWVATYKGFASQPFDTKEEAIACVEGQIWASDGRRRDTEYRIEHSYYPPKPIDLDAFERARERQADIAIYRAELLRPVLGMFLEQQSGLTTAHTGEGA